MKTIKQVIVTVLFAGLLAIPILLRPYFVKNETVADREKAIKTFGVFFEEASDKSGINFTHNLPKLDAKLDNIMPQIASMGAGVAVADFDNDGWQDFYLTNSAKGSANALYRNKTDGTFEDVASKFGVADINKDGASMGSVWGDFNSDGFEDLLVYKWGSTELFENKDGKSFERVSETGFPKKANINAAIWFDYDLDGKLDVYLGAYFRKEIDLWNLTSTKIMPESFEYASNGGRNYLFRNLGDGKFEDVTEKMGLETKRWTLAVAAADVNDDGYPDLFVSNDYAVSSFYLNKKGEKFEDLSESSGIGFAPKSGMNAAFGDVFNDGKFEIYESNIYEEGNLLQGNNLWQLADETEIKYRNIANAFGVENGGWSWSAQFADFNNDGHEDIFAANGYVSADREKSYWYDFATVTGGNEAIISDTKNWAPMKGRSLSGYQNSRVWLNDGTGKFNEQAVSVGVSDKSDGRAVAIADLWNRGGRDVIVANQGQKALIYKSSIASDNRWVSFEFQPQGNASPIGTQATIEFADGTKQIHVIDGGAGYCSQNERRAHFGLGKNRKIKVLSVQWPNGKRSKVEISETNKLHLIKQ